MGQTFYAFGRTPWQTDSMDDVKEQHSKAKQYTQNMYTWLANFLIGDSRIS